MVSAGNIASTWATLQYLGEEGYIAMAKDLMTITEKMIKEINATPGLRVVGKPHMNSFAITSRDPELSVMAACYQKNIPLIAEHFDVMTWWFEIGKHDFPLIHLVASMVLACPDSNGHQERTFSACTWMDDPLKRSTVGPTFEMKALLYRNKAFLEKHAFMALQDQQKARAEHLAERADKKVIIFDMLVDMAEKEYDIQIRKNYKPELSNASKKNKRRP